MKLISANSNPLLARAISSHLGVPLAKCEVRRFPDDEIFVEISENVRGEDVFAIQSTCHPVNDHLMELLIVLDTLRRASARRITAVIPYFGYARQDRKVGPRTPITAKLVANMIAGAGADRALSIDLHAGQIQGFFDIPTDHLYAEKVFAEDIKTRFPVDELMIVSPDAGGVLRARNLARRLGVDLAIVDKRRDQPGRSAVMNIIGKVEGRRCILIDDIADSAGTLCNAAQALIDHGAGRVSAYASHGVLSNRAIDRIVDSALDELVVTDTIPHRLMGAAASRIRVVTIAPLLGEAIRSIAEAKSISALFE